MKALAKNKILILLVVLVVIAAVVFWPRKKTKNIPVYGETNNPNNNPTTPAPVHHTPAAPGKPYTPVSPSIRGVFPLKNGSRNEYVKHLQEVLNWSNDYYKLGGTLKVDGVYGPKSIAAMSKYVSPADAARVSESVYNQIMLRYSQGIPLGRTPAGNKTWPLQLGMFDVGSEMRIRKLNVAFGVQKYDSRDPKASEFTTQLRDAIKLKLQVTSVDEKTFNYIMTAAAAAPTIFIN